MSNEIFEKKKWQRKGTAHRGEIRKRQHSLPSRGVKIWEKKNKKKNVNRLTDDGKVEIITCHCKRGFCANTADELQNPFRNVIAI